VFLVIVAIVVVVALLFNGPILGPRLAENQR